MIYYDATPNCINSYFNHYNGNLVNYINTLISIKACHDLSSVMSFTSFSHLIHDKYI